jgi:hypothetical protein
MINQKLITPELIRSAYKKFKFDFFTRDNKPYNLNLWGIRSIDLETDKYNDLIGYTYFHEGKVFHEMFTATTDPGLYYLKNPLHPKGAALLVHNRQYKKVYTVGMHQPNSASGHMALRQIAPMDYWRDDNRDGYRNIEEGQIYTQIAFTNLHSRKAGQPMLQAIGRTSAGCQVIASPNRFHGEFMPIMRMAELTWGRGISYTLFFERDIL